MVKIKSSMIIDKAEQNVLVKNLVTMRCLVEVVDLGNNTYHERIGTEW